jgi:hypothetical protein
MMCDDGWEDILDCRITFANDEAAKTFLAHEWEEYDPNAELKAAGFVWNGYYYEKPSA